MDSRPIGAPTLTLFCFPCAGASATSYLRWRRLAPNWLRIEPVEPPGRGARIDEALLSDYVAVVGDLMQRILPQATGPCALFGHSMGALLAYGCAVRLVRLGAPPPRALAVAAAAAPTRRPPPADRRKTDGELIADLRRFNAVPEEIFADAGMLRMTLDVLSADYAVCDSFARDSRPLLNTPIMIYGGLDDTLDESDLSEWRAQSLAPSSLTMFDGGHFFIREQETSFVRRMTNDIARFATLETDG